MTVRPARRGGTLGASPSGFALASVTGSGIGSFYNRRGSVRGGAILRAVLANGTWSSCRGSGGNGACLLRCGRCGRCGSLYGSTSAVFQGVGRPPGSGFLGFHSCRGLWSPRSGGSQ